jgi:hypothetical protein
MPERTFAWYPVTMERPESNQIFILNAAHYDEDMRIATVDDDYQGNLYEVATVITLNDQEFRFRQGDDELIILRPTRPDDAERWDRTRGRIPLPVEIIGAIMAQSIPEPSIAAAIDADGQVHTLILETGVGLYARYSASWIRMTDISPIEQLEIVSIPADDLDIYDAADQRGDTVNIRYLHPIDQPSATAVAASPAAVPVTAAAAPIIASVADLPDAVAYATTNTESRWYVERRWRSLGADGTGITLPWLS